MIPPLFKDLFQSYEFQDKYYVFDELSQNVGDDLNSSELAKYIQDVVNNFSYKQ